jgi:hypothetical protein
MRVPRGKQGAGLGRLSSPPEATHVPAFRDPAVRVDRDKPAMKRGHPSSPWDAAGRGDRCRGGSEHEGLVGPERPGGQFFQVRAAGPINELLLFEPARVEARAAAADLGAVYHRFEHAVEVVVRRAVVGQRPRTRRRRRAGIRAAVLRRVWQVSRQGAARCTGARCRQGWSLTITRTLINGCSAFPRDASSVESTWCAQPKPAAGRPSATRRSASIASTARTAAPFTRRACDAPSRSRGPRGPAWFGMVRALGRWAACRARPRVRMLR